MAARQLGPADAGPWPRAQAGHGTARMIVDGDEFEDGTALEADLCIVGGGAAGIALALHFADGETSVLLLESGGRQVDGHTAALGRGEVADGSAHPPVDRYRQRRLGGTTGIWGGRCMPMDPVDFEHRPWMVGPGWPFCHQTLDPWYRQANALCEAGAFAYTAEAAFPRGMRAMLPGFTGRRFSDNTLERFSCPTDFGRRYGRRLAASRAVRVVLHATVTSIRTQAEGRVVSSLGVRTGRGGICEVRTRQVVLATGGLETPRLLLCSRGVHADGIGNAFGQVGRHYMSHLAGTVGAVALGGRALHHGYEVADDGVYCRRRLALRPEAQRELGTGNFIARLHHPPIPDPSHRTGALSALYLARPFVPYEYSRRLHGQGRIGARLAHAGNIVRDPWGTAGFLADWARRRVLADRKLPSVVVRPRRGAYSIDFHAEQAPNPVSRVGLCHALDAHGMNRIRVDWRACETDRHTVREAFRALRGDLFAAGATLDYDEATIGDEATREGAYGGHHIGTTRMSADPRLGVVDAECRVHGMANLFIAGSAVFPTSGQANPTLTIVALALRLAARIEHNLRV